MISYPVEIARDANGGVRVTAPHFPELSTTGSSEQDALLHALFALEEIIGTRMSHQQVVPVPIKASPGHKNLALPDQIANVLERYWRFNLGRNAPDLPLECRE